MQQVWASTALGGAGRQAGTPSADEAGRFPPCKSRHRLPGTQSVVSELVLTLVLGRANKV